MPPRSKVVQRASYAALALLLAALLFQTSRIIGYAFERGWLPW